MQAFVEVIFSCFKRAFDLKYVEQSSGLRWLYFLCRLRNSTVVPYKYIASSFVDDEIFEQMFFVHTAR